MTTRYAQQALTWNGSAWSVANKWNTAADGSGMTADPGVGDTLEANGFTITFTGNYTADMGSPPTTCLNAAKASGLFSCATAGVQINAKVGTVAQDSVPITIFSAGNTSGTVTVKGNGLGSSASHAFSSTGGGGTLAVLGNVTGGSGTSVSGAHATGGTTLTITGNATGGGAPSACGIDTAGGTISVSGSATGGTNATAYGLSITSTGTGSVGTAIASATTPGINNTVTGGTLTYKIGIYSSAGVNPTTGFCKMLSDTTNKITAQLSSGSTLDLVPPSGVPIVGGFGPLVRGRA